MTRFACEGKINGICQVDPTRGCRKHVWIGWEDGKLYCASDVRMIVDIMLGGNYRDMYRVQSILMGILGGPGWKNATFHGTMPPIDLPPGAIM